jgi:hypothetical protein
VGAWVWWGLAEGGVAFVSGEAGVVGVVVESEGVRFVRGVPTRIKGRRYQANVSVHTAPREVAALEGGDIVVKLEVFDQRFVVVGAYNSRGPGSAEGGVESFVRRVGVEGGDESKRARNDYAVSGH